MTAVATDTKLWTRAEYHRIGDMGLLDDDRYELINGEIRRMPARGARHLAAQYGLDEKLTAALWGQPVLVRTEFPVATRQDGEPVPDIVVLRAPASRHEGRRAARPEDVLLVVEVSHTTVRKDRAEKAPLYAAAGIPAFWLLDPEDDALEVRTDPVSGVYASENVYRPGDRPTLRIGDLSVTLDVADHIPPRLMPGEGEEGQLPDAPG